MEGIEKDPMVLVDVNDSECQGKTRVHYERRRSGRRTNTVAVSGHSPMMSPGAYGLQKQVSKQR